MSVVGQSEQPENLLPVGDEDLLKNESACGCGGLDGKHTLTCETHPAVEVPQRSGSVKNEVRHDFICVKCGGEARNLYVSPYDTQMLEYRLCFFCNLKKQRSIEFKGKEHTLTIINGRIYAPGNNTTGNFRGCGGRRFDIEYIGASPFAGKKITTFDLWVGGDVGDEYREQFPDTAKFEDCETWVVGEIKGLNQVMNNKKPQYPLPREIGIK